MSRYFTTKKKNTEYQVINPSGVAVTTSVLVKGIRPGRLAILYWTAPLASPAVKIFVGGALSQKHRVRK